MPRQVDMLPTAYRKLIRFPLAAHQIDPHWSLSGAEGTFRPDRIRPIAARFNLDADAVLENVSPDPSPKPDPKYMIKIPKQ